LKALNDFYIRIFGFKVIIFAGTSNSTNPNAMDTIFKNSVFTNVAKTSDGGVFWEGMPLDPNVQVTDWTGKPWTPDCGRNAAHPNSRYITKF